MKPKKHAAVIKAWADGADVEFYSTVDRQWKPSREPAFADNLQYRVAPQRELSDAELADIYNKAYVNATLPLYPTGEGHRIARRAVAKAAVRHYRNVMGMVDIVINVDSTTGE
jgi:hypothetical protein